jgi:UDP-N-acetylmuramoyl-L-alanyl-D-glutamate--2,6-diaminopimelate ligase
MRLSELLRRTGIAAKSTLNPETDPEISSVALDSRKVRPGALFCAVRGTRQDGNDWADRALESGAVAILTDRQELFKLRGRIAVPSVPYALGPLCRILTGEPDRNLLVMAVTGTNGKTSSCYLAESVFREAGLAPALSSTVIQRHPGGEAQSS